MSQFFCWPLFLGIAWALELGTLVLFSWCILVPIALECKQKHVVCNRFSTGCQFCGFNRIKLFRLPVVLFHLLDPPTVKSTSGSNTAAVSSPSLVPMSDSLFWVSKLTPQCHSATVNCVRSNDASLSPPCGAASVPQVPSTLQLRRSGRRLISAYLNNNYYETKSGGRYAMITSLMLRSMLSWMT